MTIHLSKSNAFLNRYLNINVGISTFLERNLKHIFHTALRVSDEMSQLNNDQIEACLEHSFHWPLNTVSQSWTLQKIIQSLDSVCHQRILQETWESNDQLYRVAYLMSLNLLKVRISDLKRGVTIFTNNKLSTSLSTTFFGESKFLC